jgi:hypothetical protein
VAAVTASEAAGSTPTTARVRRNVVGIMKVRRSLGEKAEPSRRRTPARVTPPPAGARVESGADFMPLPAGARLGPYEITALLGQGGMGACGPRRASVRVEPPWRGGGRLRACRASASVAEALAEARAPRHFLTLTDLAHPGVPRWR